MVWSPTGGTWWGVTVAVTLVDFSVPDCCSMLWPTVNLKYLLRQMASEDWVRRAKFFLAWVAAAKTSTALLTCEPCCWSVRVGPVAVAVTALGVITASMKFLHPGIVFAAAYDDDEA